MSAGWWKDETDPASQVWAHIRALETRQRTRISRNFINEKIYGNSVGIDRSSGNGGFMPADLNFTRAIVDALVARLGNDRPAVHYPADGAEWTARRRAREYDKVIEGFLESQSIPAMAPLVLRDALVTSGGIGIVEAHDGQLVADRVPCEELFFDERESRYGKPRQMHRVMRYSKEVLAERFPKKRAAIEQAPAPVARHNDFEALTGDPGTMVEVATSWHLPSKKGAKDGRRLITIPGVPDGVLDDTPYKRSKFPIAVLRWSPPRRGYWGASLVDELAALQYKVNEVARDLMANIYFTSSLKVAVRRNANIEKKTLAGKKPHFVEMDAPGDIQWLAPDGFSLAQFQFLQWLIQQMYAVSGTNELMVQGKNTLGAGASGAALNEVYQQDSERFSQLEQACARWWCDMAELGLEAARDLAEDEDFAKSEMAWPKKGVIQRVKWPKPHDDEEFRLSLEASGFMPNTRGGKMQAIEQLIANGMIDPKWATSLIEYPDLKRAQMVQNSAVETALWAMDEIADCELNPDEEVDLAKSKPVPAPDPHMDLDFTMSVAKAFYNNSIREGDPHAVTARYLQFIDALDAEMKKAAKGAPAPAGPPMDSMAAAMPADPMAAMGVPPAAALPAAPAPMPMGALP